jgi:hypothetical protein
MLLLTFYSQLPATAMGDVAKASIMLRNRSTVTAYVYDFILPPSSHLHVRIESHQQPAKLYEQHTPLHVFTSTCTAACTIQTGR